MSEEIKTNTAEEPVEKAEPAESMADFAEELEASYKAFDQRAFETVEEDEDMSQWDEFRKMMEERTVVKVKINEIVNGGAVTSLEGVRAFIPASKLAGEYVEDLSTFEGKSIEAILITVNPADKKLVLSGRDVIRDRQKAEKEKLMDSCQVGSVLDGTVESIMPYGAFVKLENGLSGLVHISQISNTRIKHPGAVLKEGQKVKVKLTEIKDGKLSLSMKALEQSEDTEPEEHFEYAETESAFTGLGSLLKGIKL